MKLFFPVSVTVREMFIVIEKLVCVTVVVVPLGAVRGQSQRKRLHHHYYLMLTMLTTSVMSQRRDAGSR